MLKKLISQISQNHPCDHNRCSWPILEKMICLCR